MGSQAKFGVFSPAVYAAKFGAWSMSAREIFLVGGAAEREIWG